MNQEILEKHLNSKFAGRRIVNVRFMTKTEAKMLGVDVDKCPLVFFLDDGTQFCSIIDKEGGHEGAQLLTNIKKYHLINTH